MMNIRLYVYAFAKSSKRTRHPNNYTAAWLIIFVDSQIHLTHSA